jgi:hypothetical protein
MFSFRRCAFLILTILIYMYSPPLGHFFAKYIFEPMKFRFGDAHGRWVNDELGKPLGEEYVMVNEYEDFDNPLDKLNPLKPVPPRKKYLSYYGSTLLGNLH